MHDVDGLWTACFMLYFAILCGPGLAVYGASVEHVKRNVLVSQRQPPDDFNSTFVPQDICLASAFYRCEFGVKTCGQITRFETLEMTNFSSRMLGDGARGRRRN